MSAALTSLARRGALGVAAALSLLASSACAKLEDVAPGTLVTCTTASECPSGRVCNAAGRCVESDNTTGPDLATSVTVSPGRVAAGQAFTVAFETTRPLGGAPKVTLPGVSVRLTCAARSPVRQECTYTPSGAENGGQGGVLSIDVEMKDLVGNPTARSGVGTVAFDFAPPSPTVATVAYQPGPANPLASVRRATAGTVVRVVVSADEVLSRPGDPSWQAAALTGRSGSAALAFTPVVVPGLHANDAAFEAEVPDLEPDGAYTLAVTWSDDLGNRGTSLVAATVDVKTSAPVLAVDQDALVFVRSPWGNAAPEDLGGHVVPAGPLFALEPTETSTTTPTLPGGALLLAGSVVPASVIVQSDSSASAQVLGVLRPDAAGRFPRARLVSPDLLGIWLVGVDDAGNRSAPVQIRTAEWRATTGAPLAGASPVAVSAVAHVAASRTQELASPVTGTGAAGTDAASVLVASRALWRARSWTGLALPGRQRHAMAYDAARGRVVSFGGWVTVKSGFTMRAVYFGDTWEWDGAGWAQVAATGPSARGDHAMAWDGARGRAVLFGGADGAQRFGDTWVWNGAAWAQAATAGPSPRSGHAMAYDAGRGVVLLFGGVDAAGACLGDTWAWDGKAWSQVASAGPSPRGGHAMAYDAARGVVVLFGGGDAAGAPLGDTFEWTGSSWAPRATSGPSARGGHAMAYDPVAGAVVLCGGQAVAAMDTWAWNGSAWAPLAGAAPGGRIGHAVAFDVVHGQLVLFGGGPTGGGPGALSDTWTRDAKGWAAVTTAAPTPRNGHAMAFDAARGRTILFGGYDSAGLDTVGDTWAYDGTSWVQVATTGVSVLYHHAMAYDGDRDRVVLFGGDTNGGPYPKGTWEWNGTSWAQVAATGASARVGHAMAYDSRRKRTVLFGGRTFGAEYAPETLEWDGATWTSVAAGGPAGRTDHAMAYDAARGCVVLFGGANASGAFQDTWEWSGSAWTQRATSGPSPRSAHAMAYDGTRRRVVLYGGVTGSSSTSYLGDTWEWDGSAWRPLAERGPPARGRSAMVWDSVRGDLVVFGGSTSVGRAQDTWTTWPAPDAPALQVEVPSRSLGVDVSRVTRLAARAYAGGAAAPGGAALGAALYGWVNRGPANEPGTWTPLAVNATGVAATPPYLPGAPASLVEWSTASNAEARRFFVDESGLAFQVRDAGSPAAAPDLASAAVDFLEVRVRYAVP